MPTIKINQFAGNSGVADGTLATAIAIIAAIHHKNAASALADLTDNSGGAAADGTVGAIPLASATPATNATCPTKAEVEVSFGLVKDALTEIGAKVVAIAAVVPAFTPTNSIGGAAADGTIAALDMDFAGAAAGGGTCVAKAGFNTLVAAYTNVVAELVRDVNVLAVACGHPALNAPAVLANLNTFNNTYEALATSTGTAATNGLTSVTEAEAEASFIAMGAAVKELATKCNQITTAGTHLNVFPA